MSVSSIAEVVSAGDAVDEKKDDDGSATVQLMGGQQQLLANFEERHGSSNTDSAARRTLGSVLQLPMYYLEELFAHLERFMTSGALQVPLQSSVKDTAATPVPLW
ncbi:hypothetical protein BESB_009950 [Besnoitia besnoiti]|uniref:Uncharacterized protein n=1 Tax=Besnoitia besnoiti TaxID=94643 RepID=A0A2A9MQP4_BESBE|nr:hypothetical protein BESB_009950 [Besnoitia besnoiti]PFH38653.1 hypothetical protein BESB_009950 [Besnoitia besnoiti]